MFFSYFAVCYSETLFVYFITVYCCWHICIGWWSVTVMWKN